MALVQALDTVRTRFSRGVFALLVTMGIGPVAMERIVVKTDRR